MCVCVCVCVCVLRVCVCVECCEDGVSLALLQGLARSKRIKKTKPDDLQECLQLAVYRLMFPGVR